MTLEQRIRKFIGDMRKATSTVVPAVIANDLQEIIDTPDGSMEPKPSASNDIRTAIGADLDRLVGAMFRSAMSDNAFRNWALSDGQPVAWEFRDNSWPAGMWASITKAQYDGYLGPDVTGPRDSWQVRALHERPAPSFSANAAISPIKAAATNLFGTIMQITSGDFYESNGVDIRCSPWLDLLAHADELAEEINAFSEQCNG